MKTGIIVAFGALAFLAGCQNKSAEIHIPPKWQGAAYHLSFGPAPAKANPSGLTMPQIKYDADPEQFESRVDLVVQFDPAAAKVKGTVMNQMAMAAVTIVGPKGALPDDYVERASTDLGKMLQAYNVNGKVKISVALTRSSLEMNPSTDQIDAKRLSDWTPIELDFKNPHHKR